MNVDALPFTLLILLAEFAIGGLWVLVASDLRGMVAKSFVKFGAALILVMAAFTFWVAAKVHVSADVDGYPLDPAYMGGVRIALGLFFALTFPYLYLALRESRRPSLVVGGLASAAGLASLALMAQVFAAPTWGYVGTFLSLLVGTMCVGAVSIGMVLGHWYLVTPRLPTRPLREVTFFLLMALATQVVLLAPALALPVRQEPANALDVSIGQNPFFWMRVGGGLLFPMALAYMAWDSSGVRAMQSATGLLYLAMALVLSGEVLGKGLLFVTAIPS